MDTVIIRNTREPAPNISLNSHNRVSKLELRLAAVFAVLLHLGLLAYFWFATYYNRRKFRKNGNLIDKYAFPCSVVGTVVLVTGMLLCSHVVESSTSEARHRPVPGEKARIVWLQKTKTVSDQVFKSFAIFAEDDRPVIMTSSRADRTGTVTSATVLQTKTIIGVLISVAGFVMQFSGLRGMHCSAPVVQLGSVLTMTVVRALVRRGLATPPQSIQFTSGFELEWFAMTLGDPDNAPWNTSKPHAEVVKDWRIITGGSSTIYKELQEVEKEEKTLTKVSKAHEVMMIRKGLEELAGWHGPASTEAISLARAIEITMDALIGSSHTGDYIWTL